MGSYLKKTLLVGGIFLINGSILLGQNYASQILNKEVIRSATSLTQDYDGDGDLDIILIQRNPDRLIWLENEPTKQFPVHVIIDSGITEPFDLDIADIDNDGDSDYVISSSSSNTFEGELVWFQKQDDNRYIKRTIDSGKDYDRSDLADFNGDGNIDIVSVGKSQDSINVFLNDGNLNFTPQLLTGSITQVVSVDANDIDGDGDVDIAFGDGNNDGELFLNTGGGNFAFAQELYGWSDNSASIGNNDIQIIDLNNDGARDIVSFSGQGLGGLYFLDGRDDFDQTLIDRDGVDTGGGMVIVDFDQNGLLDIARSHDTDHFISVLYQISPLVFDKQYIELEFNTLGSQMTSADIDDDGDLDLIVPQNSNFNIHGNNILWFENIDGELFRHQLHGLTLGARIPKLADFDGDGDKDIFVSLADYNPTAGKAEIMLFENLDGTNFFNWRIKNAIENVVDIEIGDMNDDGYLDVVASAKDSNELMVLLNEDFQANWEKIIIDDTLDQPLGLDVGDIDSDGDKDIVLCSYNDENIFAYINDGSFNFLRTNVDSSIPNPKEVEIVDLNGDTHIDIVAITEDIDNSILIYLSNGNGGYSKETVYSGKIPSDIEVGDWNGDDNLDILVSFFTSVKFPNSPIDVLLLSNDGEANFSPLELISFSEKSQGISLNDMDNDGDLDIVMAYDLVSANDDISLISIAINEGGLINQIVSLSNMDGGDVLGIDVADLDGDNLKEIIYADSQRNDLVLIDYDLPNLGAEKIIINLTDIIVHPNPSDGEININIPNSQMELEELIMFNSMGQRIDLKDLSKSELKINTSLLSGGIYYLSLKTSIGNVTKKLVVKR